MNIETVRLTNGEEFYGIVKEKLGMVIVIDQYRWSEYYRSFNFIYRRTIPAQNILSIGA